MLNSNDCEIEDYDKEEEMRLQELYNYEMLHTPREETIDSITKLTQIICRTPICLVSLLNEKKQWFKSRQGLDVEDTDRDISFCKYAIKQESIFEVKNTLEDPRFVNNPLVTGFPYIRHYAGMPLKSPNGYKIGTLCVIDTKPGELNDDQKTALQTLAKQVIMQFEMKKVLKELKLANDKSLKLSLVKDEFLSNMSHELRTPLNAIYGFTEILQNSVKDSKQKEYLDIIKSSVEILISIINDILDFSKIELGKLVIEKKPFTIKKAVKEIFELLKQKAIEKNIYLGFNISSNVPDVIVGDKVRLNQILVNLIGNAIKFTNKGKVELLIRRVKNTLVVKKEEGEESPKNNINNNLDQICILNKFVDKKKLKFQRNCTIVSSVNSNLEDNSSPKKMKQQEIVDLAELEFIVKDTGIGIKDDKLDKIFERFEQASSDITRKYGGSGLGLSISRNLVELQGGEITVKSVYEKGSEFSFKIAYDYQRKQKDGINKDICFSNFFEVRDQSEKSSSNESSDFSKFEDSIIFDTDKQNEELKSPQVNEKNKDKDFDSNQIQNDENFIKGANNFKVMSLNKTDHLEKIKENIFLEIDDSHKINILLCEDNNFNIKLIEKILFDSPFRDNINLDIAYNGKIGGEMVKNNPKKFDLILMDLQMPEMNGLETSEYIRKQLKLSLPIVAMTANICSIERKKCMEHGINDYFTKPFNKKEFFDCFNILLKKKIDRIKDFTDKKRNKSRNRSFSPKKNELNEKTESNNYSKKGSDKTDNKENLRNCNFRNTVYNSSRNLIKDFMSNNQKIIRETKNNYISFQNLINSQRSKINNFNLNLNDKPKNELNTWLSKMDSKNSSERKNNNSNANSNKNNNNNSQSKTKIPDKSLKIYDNMQEVYTLNDKKEPLTEDLHKTSIKGKVSFYQKILEFKKDFLSNTYKETNSFNKKNNSEFNDTFKAFKYFGYNLKTNETFDRKFFNKTNTNTILPPNIYNPKTIKVESDNNKIPFKDNSFLKNDLLKTTIKGFGNKEASSSFYDCNQKNRNIPYKITDNSFRESLNPTSLNKKTKDDINKIIVDNNNNKLGIRKSITMNHLRSEDDHSETLYKFNNKNTMEYYDNKSLSKIKDSILKGDPKNKDLPIINNLDNNVPTKITITDIEIKDKLVFDKPANQQIHSGLGNENDSIAITQVNKNIMNESQKNQFNINNIFNFNLGNDKNFLNIGNEFKINLEKEKINFETFKEFTGEDPDTEREIIESFLKEFPILVDELECAIKKNNFDEISKVCHKMKSPVALFGLNILKEKLIKIDDFSKFIIKSMESLSRDYPAMRTSMQILYKDLYNISYK